ncbi:MAG: Flp pilus assembly protein CpaB [Chloroflexi bacterium]|nr:Flp pilus assembly protein CpaB [Chloroflexota bacterium]
MKRSNRLVLLIGALLAVVAFVGVVLLLNNGTTGSGGTPAPTAPTTAQVVFAKVDIPAGTVISADMVELRAVALAAATSDSIPDPGLAVSKTIRRSVKAGTELTYGYFVDLGTTSNVTDNLPQGLRAMAIQVSQLTGVGTLIHTGDNVDVIIAIKIQNTIADTKNPGQVVTVGAAQPTVKMILQNIKVIGTLLPPPTQTPAQQQAAPSPGASAVPQQPSTTLNGQSEIVVVAVTANQAEAIRYAQLYDDPATDPISLVLRSPKDYLTASGSPTIPPLDKTDGVVLQTLIDKYGVLPPSVILH